MRTILLVLAAAYAGGAQTQPEILSTTDGTRFGVMGGKPSAPAPTLLVFASSLEASLKTPFNDVGTILAKQGFLQVALDLPSHGRLQQEGAPNALRSWRDRLERGEDFLPPFLATVSRVVDHLIAQGYTDPKRVYAAGTSRGGFVAVHFAAHDPRVRAVAGFAPVTNLLALREFEGMEHHARTRAMALAQLAGKLRERPIWIWIGTTDHRVDTQSAIDFAMRVVETAEAKGDAPQIELHLHPSESHRVGPNAHQEAAAWFLAH